MSEVKLISPLLDGFAMGNPMSEHDGVRCCPAIKEHTDKKYIVKIISVPATQAQLDALLLAGAYKDPADAMEYFRQVGEGILEEAQLLKTLSRLDGFLPYEGWQMEPITRRRLGYQVYLVGSYKRSLEKHMKSHPITHLEAINLGLDLCAALTVCREAGALYVALTPANVFVSENKEYRIGDLGFIQLNALRYSALPEKYFSPYTAPELFDPMGNVNLTVDTYALGMMLYQLYNDGRIPFKGKQRPEEALPSPLNADYELAEIIMKAIDPDPANRWTDPKDMGKALAEYMQRNAINDVPITPHTPLDVKPEDILPVEKNVQPEPEEAVTEAAEAPAVQAEEEIAEAMDEVVSASTEEAAAESPTEADMETVEVEEASEELPEALEEEMPVEQIASPAAEEAVVSEEAVPIESDISAEEASALEESAEETVEDKPKETVSPELSKMLAQAEDLISHVPEFTLPEETEPHNPFSFVLDEDELLEETAIAEESASEETEPGMPELKSRKNQRKFVDAKYKRRKKRIAGALSAAALLALLGAGGYWYYQNQYVVAISDLVLEAKDDSISVSINSKKEDGAWFIKCIRPDGTTYTHGASSGTTLFSGLEPNTEYTIQVEIDGLHKLTGQTTGMITTEPTTKILSFTPVAGPEDGSVVLTLEMEGQEPKDWTVIYSAEGEQELRKSFSGNTVTIMGLTVGKDYTFQLDTGENIALGGQTSVEYMPSKLVVAENLYFTSEDGSQITANWSVSGGAMVEQWVVKCYNSRDYEQELVVSEPTATFSGMDPTTTYTLEVTASGMTKATVAHISANPLNITSLTADNSDSSALKLRWDYTGENSGSWKLQYHLSGGTQNTVSCESASGEISPKIPGAKYAITLQSTDGTTVLNSSHSYTVPQAEAFAAHGLAAEGITAKLLKTPDANGWLAEKQEDSAFGSIFASGDGISIALFTEGKFQRPGSDLEILYVIRDAYGNILPDLVSTETTFWHRIWNNGNVSNAELKVPAVPIASGEYVLELYFNGMEVTKLPFTIQ